MEKKDGMTSDHFLVGENFRILQWFRIQNLTKPSLCIFVKKFRLVRPSNLRLSFFVHLKTRWWFHFFFIFIPILGKKKFDEHIFQMGRPTTNQKKVGKSWRKKPSVDSFKRLEVLFSKEWCPFCKKVAAFLRGAKKCKSLVGWVLGGWHFLPNYFGGLFHRPI